MSNPADSARMLRVSKLRQCLKALKKHGFIDTYEVTKTKAVKSQFGNKHLVKIQTPEDAHYAVEAIVSMFLPGVLYGDKSSGKHFAFQEKWHDMSKLLTAVPREILVEDVVGAFSKMAAAQSAKISNYADAVPYLPSAKIVKELQLIAKNYI